jgi:hypothetical protein
MTFSLGPWIARTCLLLAGFALLGGHWAVLQSVAWTGMVWNYSQEAGLLGGLEKTFSGEAPCKLCKTIVDARKTERQEKSADRSNPETLKASLTRRAELPPILFAATPPPVLAAGFPPLTSSEVATPPPRRA